MSGLSHIQPPARDGSAALDIECPATPRADAVAKIETTIKCTGTAVTEGDDPRTSAITNIRVAYPYARSAATVRRRTIATHSAADGGPSAGHGAAGGDVERPAGIDVEQIVGRERRAGG